MHSITTNGSSLWPSLFPPWCWGIITCKVGKQHMLVSLPDLELATGGCFSKGELLLCWWSIPVNCSPEPNNSQLQIFSKFSLPCFSDRYNQSYLLHGILTVDTLGDNIFIPFFTVLFSIPCGQNTFTCFVLFLKCVLFDHMMRAHVMLYRYLYTDTINAWVKRYQD